MTEKNPGAVAAPPRPTGRYQPVRLADRPEDVPLAGDPARMFRVKVVADSVPADARRAKFRALTFRVTAPRVILAEINTHRMHTHSSESSRAIPAAVRIGQVERDPYRPLRLGARVRGMGAGASLEDREARRAAEAWDFARRACLDAARACGEVGLAKEELNRLLEPWALCRTVITGSEWENFFALRTHDAAHPAFRYLARAMYVASRRSRPAELSYVDWHLPFLTAADRAAARDLAGGGDGGGGGDVLALAARAVAPVRKVWKQLVGGLDDLYLAAWSAARCCRVSYGLLDGRPADPLADFSTFLKLTARGDGQEEGADPIHASPLEHPMTPLHPAWEQTRPEWRGNSPGWLQLRKVWPREKVTDWRPGPEALAGWEAEIPPEVFSDADIY